MANVLSVDDQILVLHHLVEGNSIRSIQRVTGIDKKTILKLLVRFGRACREFLDRNRGTSVDASWPMLLLPCGIIWNVSRRV